MDCFYLGNDIYTSIKIKTNERLKGSLVENQTFEIVKYGGELDGMRVYTVDDASFSKGEKVLLFLEEKLSETIGLNFVVNAMSQGKFEIEDNYITRSSSVPLMTEKNGQLLHTQKDSGESKDVLINLIKDYTTKR